MPSESALAVRPVNTVRRTITLKGELARYDAREPLAGMSPIRRVVRAQAKAIIEGRRRWPRELLEWRTRREIAYWHGSGPANPWEDERNLTRPQRERALFMDRKHTALVARLNAASRNGDMPAHKAACAALRDFYAVDCAL